MHSGIIKEKELSLELFELFSDFIHQKSGIYLDEGKMDSLRMSLLPRVIHNKLSSYAEYYDFLKSDKSREDEFKELLNLITINETSFFRNPNQFRAIKEVVLPEIINRKYGKDQTIRIWAAGCSSGEEPYSIAMIIRSTLLDRKNWKIHILGTDISERVLELARDGIYPKKNLRGLDEYHQRVFFEEKGKNSFAIKDSVKEIVEFKYFNLIGTPYPLSEMKNWDIIFCRNVTIYFNAESTRRVIHNFYNGLTDGGYLFIGHSETLNNVSDEFTLVEAKGTFFYKKGNKNSLPIGNKQGVLTPCLDREISTGISDQSLGAVCAPALSAGEKACLLVKQAEKCSNEGKMDDAAKACIEAEDADPLSLKAYFLLGMIYYKIGNNQDSITQFRKVIYLNPHYFLAHYYLGDIYLKLGEFDNALMFYNNTVEYLQKNNYDIDNDDFIKGVSREMLISTCENNIREIRKNQGADNV